MTRAKPKTPGRPKLGLSPALTRSSKKTRNTQSRIAELIGSPGWTDAAEVLSLFKSPLPSPAPAKKMAAAKLAQAAAAPRRSSVYRSREASKVMKTSASSFKVPAAQKPPGRRASVYQGPGADATSPTLTRSRRSSVYQAAYAKSHSKVFHSPAVTTSTRRMTMATMDIIAKSPPKLQAANTRRQSTFTAMQPMSPMSPVSPAESEVTFNIKGPIDFTTSPKAAGSQKRGRKASPKHAVAKASPKPAAAKASPKPVARGRKPTRTASPKRKKSPVKPVSPKRKPSPAKKPASAKPAPKAPTRQTKIPKTAAKAKSPVAKKRKSTDGAAAASAGVKSAKIVKAAVTTPNKPAVKAPAKNSPKVLTPKSTPKSTSSLASTPKNTSSLLANVKVTPNTAKALKGSPRVKVTRTAFAASPKLAEKKTALPKTPVMSSIKAPAKTPTGLSTPLRTLSLSSKSPAVTPKSFYATPKATAAQKVAPKSTAAASPLVFKKLPTAKASPVVVAVTKIPAKASPAAVKKIPAKASPAAVKKIPGAVFSSPAKKVPVKKSLSSPVVASAKTAFPKKVPSVSHVTIEIPPKAARVLGRTPSNKIKQRKVTPGRTPGLGERCRTLRSSEISLFQTSTPVEPSRKRFADIPISEIRAPEKKIKMDETSTSVNLEKADLLKEEAPAGEVHTMAVPSTGYMWGWGCNIL